MNIHKISYLYKNKILFIIVIKKIKLILILFYSTPR